MELSIDSIDYHPNTPLFYLIWEHKNGKIQEKYQQLK